MFLMAATAAIALAADKTDFSGTWTLDVSKSDFGMMPPPQKMVRTITHADPSMKISTKQTSDRGEMTMEMSYTTDGKEATVKVRNRDAKVKAKWAGANLKVESKSEFQGGELTQNETWVLSEDKNTLTITNEVNSPMGATTAKLIFTKGN
jgi:hypothetical protein